MDDKMRHVFNEYRYLILSISDGGSDTTNRSCSSSSSSSDWRALQDNSQQPHTITTSSTAAYDHWLSLLLPTSSSSTVSTSPLATVGSLSPFSSSTMGGPTPCLSRTSTLSQPYSNPSPPSPPSTTKTMDKNDTSALSAKIQALVSNPGLSLDEKRQSLSRLIGDLILLHESLAPPTPTKTTPATNRQSGVGLSSRAANRRDNDVIMTSQHSQQVDTDAPLNLSTNRNKIARGSNESRHDRPSPYPPLYHYPSANPVRPAPVPSPLSSLLIPQSLDDSPIISPPVTSSLSSMTSSMSPTSSPTSASHNSFSKV